MSIIERRPPSIDGEAGGSVSRGSIDSPDWLSLAREAYSSSTTYVDANYRQKWEDAIRAFNNQHPLTSKYTSSAFAKRSNIFRPKTRSIIRKNEAAGAAAFFSNVDVVSVEAVTQSNPKQVASAAIMKELLGYRLNASKKAGGIPWFQFVMGGLQDAQTTGTVAAHVTWRYASKTKTFQATTNEDGEQTLPDQTEEIPTVDRPECNLVPIENIRIDPSAAWDDPVDSSPYIIHLMPMYAGDVKARMRERDPKTGAPKWKKQDDAIIRSATSLSMDSTRVARQKGREDPMENTARRISDYEIVWVQRHIHRRDGEDWDFYTLGDVALLTDPVKLSETELHGARPYVLGCAILETHKVMPSGIPELVGPLQSEANEVVNQRLDNVKLVLNKRWIVKRGRNVDTSSLIRNVPGGITMADNPAEDIQKVEWQDVTASSYQEQDRINVDMDELAGNFSAGSVQTNRKLNETVGGMRMISSSSSALVEYLLRTYVETFIEPVLRLLVKLEQKYETDQVILSIAADKAQLMQKFGIDKVTDDLLQHELTVKVNVGMGATDPITKQQKLSQAIGMYSQIAMQPPPGLNIEEVAKEIWAFAGYQDGKRFMTQNPDVAALTQKLQQASQVIQQLQMKEQSKTEDHQTKLAIADKNNAGKIITQDMKHHHERDMKAIEHAHEVLNPPPPPQMPIRMQ